jgi:hypothetical protein
MSLRLLHASRRGCESARALLLPLDELGTLENTSLGTATRRRTCAAAGGLFAIPAEMILSRQGPYGLVTNIGQLAVFFTALCACVRGLRKWRGVRPPQGETNRFVSGSHATVLV